MNQQFNMLMVFGNSLLAFFEKIFLLFEYNRLLDYGKKHSMSIYKIKKSSCLFSD